MDDGMRNLAWAIGLEGYFQSMVESAPEYPRQMAVIAYAFFVMTDALTSGIKALRAAPPQEPSWWKWVNAR